MKIHVEAAAFNGRPVYFEILDEWDQPRRAEFSIARFRDRFLLVLLLTAFITALVGSALLALRNVKLGRGDRKGAFRLASFVLAIFFLRWLFSSHHVASELEALNFISGVQTTLFWTIFFWVMYLAFEPFVRKRWPGRIISWSRLLAGGTDYILALIICLALTVFGFYTSLAGQPLFRGALPDD